MRLSFQWIEGEPVVKHKEILWFCNLGKKWLTSFWQEAIGVIDDQGMELLHCHLGEQALDSVCLPGAGGTKNKEVAVWQLRVTVLPINRLATW